MRAASRAAAPALAAATLLAGCGSSGAPATTRAPVALTAAERQGKQLFVPTCGSCHTLADAGTHGVAGPSLDEGSWNRAFLREVIADGPGLMPANLLRGTLAADVAAYVAAVTQR